MIVHDPVFLAVSFAPAPAGADTRVALVIGNGHYEHAEKLANPVTDARNVRDALTKMVEGRTSIIIAHRLSTIQRADRILVMHKGKLRESGSHQELLAVRGIYWKLYQLQYKDQERQAMMFEPVRPHAEEEVTNL